MGLHNPRLLIRDCYITPYYVFVASSPTAMCRTRGVRVVPHRPSVELDLQLFFLEVRTEIQLVWEELCDLNHVDAAELCDPLTAMVRAVERREGENARLLARMGIVRASVSFRDRRRDLMRILALYKEQDLSSLNVVERGAVRIVLRKCNCYTRWVRLADTLSRF